MTKPHKWANEIIHWANGGEIEYLDGAEWAVAYTPVWDEGGQYRIKPQPKEKNFVYLFRSPLDGTFYIAPIKNAGNTLIGKIEVLND